MNKLIDKVKEIILKESESESFTSESLTDINTIEYMNEIVKYGCKSGIVTELIYTENNIDFYNEYKNEIEEFINDIEMNIGIEDIREIIKDWEYTNELEHNVSNIDEDIKNYNSNVNSLVWLVFEEIVYNLLNELEN